HGDPASGDANERSSRHFAGRPNNLRNNAVLLPLSRPRNGRTDVDLMASPNPVWRLQAIRPAASSGISGSGLEVRFCDYKGKRILYRGHMPILNVKYDGDACGPYRDWQFDEHCFQCDGTDLGPGFRRANTAPKTACNGSDSGNFTGVAVYETNCELILTTEMEAGWYRYIQEWRFHRDGSIRPRFKFTAVSNSCV